MNPWKAALLGFFDGYGACVSMFNRNIRVPGSPSSQLSEITKPEMLSEHRAIDPLLPDLLIKLMANALARDRAYARVLRVMGSLQLAAVVAAIWFLAAHNRF